MQLNSAVCPNCGGNLQLDPSMGRGYCLHCGSNIIIEDGVQRQKIELSGKVEVDGIATVNSSLMRANQLFDSGDYDNAVKAFKKVLEADPSSHEAWWGAYLCEMAFAEYYRKLYNESRSGAKWADTIIENLNTYAYRAIEYAPQETKQRYQAAIKEDEEFAQKYQSRKSGKQKNGCYIATAVYGLTTRLK
jgi:tetratricopeptide (TPR) repeat protein